MHGNQSGQPLIIAHRGASAEAPENTASSFLLAIEQQCDMMELDIQLTKDDQFIVCHDDSVNRTTNGNGMIHEMTAMQLKQLDAGSWFNPAFHEERLLLLQELFEFVPPAIGLNIEVKCLMNSEQQKKLIRLVHEYDRIRSVVFSCFDHKQLYRLKKAAPEARIGLLFTGRPVQPAQLVRDFGLDVYSVHPYYQLIDAEDIQALRSSGQKIYVWTANEPAAMQRLIDLGVSGIITDYPGRLRKLLHNRTIERRTSYGK